MRTLAILLSMPVVVVVEVIIDENMVIKVRVVIT